MLMRASRRGRPHSAAAAALQLCLFPPNLLPPPQHGRLCRNKTDQPTAPKPRAARTAAVDLTPSQVTVPAASAPRPQVLGPRSVFDLGASVVLTAAPEQGEAAERPAASRVPARVVHVQEEGRSVYRGVSYPAARATPEDDERERQRRARQKPPRPPRQKFKMKNSKVWNDPQQ